MSIAHASDVVSESSNVIRELYTPHSPPFLALTFYRSNLSDGTKSSCVQCTRSGDECIILAESRRGGDFSRSRRSYRGRSSTTSSRANIGHGSHDKQVGDDEKVIEDPIYAELTNPGDALQILAQLAANDSQVHNPNDSTSLDPFPVTPSAKQEGSDTAVNADGPIDPTVPPVLQSTLSETETLVIGVLGTDTVCRLIHQYGNLSISMQSLFF